MRFVFEDVRDEKCVESHISVDSASQNLVTHKQSQLCICMHMNSIKMKKAIMQQVTELIRFVS